VVSQDGPAFLHFGSGDLLEKMAKVIGRWHATDKDDQTGLI